METFNNNPMRFYAEVPSMAIETNKKLTSTYWGDFRVGAELGGIKGIEETYKNGLWLAKSDKVYGTEFSLILNWLGGFYYERDKEKSEKFFELWEKFHGWVLDNWKGDDLTYYLHETD